MKAIFKHITLVYSVPKYVTVILDCDCYCGRIATNALVCFKYGRIHVECKTCKDTALLRLDRKVVYDFHMKGFPHLLQSLDDFLDRWQIDMIQ